MIDQKDFMHGAALVAIADSAEFTALNRASVKYGHYVVNHDRHLFIKYNGGSGPGVHHFTFSGRDKERIRTTNADRVRAVFVCGNEVITAITRTALAALLDLGSAASSTVNVSALRGQQLRIHCGATRHPGLVARGSFPSSVLA